MSNDHYVPQFYLRNFSPTGAKGRIWCYERNQRPCLKGIKYVACEEDFYQFTDATGQKDNTIEKFYDKATENPAAPVIKKIIAMDHIFLSDDERETVAHFIGHLITRNPLYRPINVDHLEYLKDEESFLARVETVELTVEEAKQRRAEILSNPETFLEEVNRDKEQLTVSGPIPLAIDYTVEILQRQWLLIESDCSRIFITSDNPVSIVPRKSGSKKSGFINHTLYLPLSPSKCLLLKQGDGFARTIKIKRENVDEANYYTMRIANSAVYSNLKSKHIENGFNQTPRIQDCKAAFAK
jgi:hypothetical protein